MTPPPTAAALRERDSDSAYGEAQHHFPGDLDGDGDVDSTDTGAKNNAKPSRPRAKAARPLPSHSG